ncbi:MAG: hypothetical protein HYX34_00540 [Actinobacteria bacterium]|nr:hypothetical protein [Actinomycetota bacterium]
MLDQVPADDPHRRPEGTSDEAVSAAGKLSEALEWVERSVREALVGGRRHIHESEMNEDRRTQGRPAHEARPGTGT